ncbi:MAG: hypothetical protein J5625_09655 [Lachnospiraceae bacterium]|nr:hypothetical protein [Lachnospiraceae bacterium]
MKIISVVNGPKNISAIVQGCMRMPALSKEDAAKVIRTAYDCGCDCMDSSPSR